MAEMERQICESYELNYMDKTQGLKDHGNNIRDDKELDAKKRKTQNIRKGALLMLIGYIHVLFYLPEEKHLYFEDGKSIFIFVSRILGLGILPIAAVYTVMAVIYESQKHVIAVAWMVIIAITSLTLSYITLHITQCRVLNDLCKQVWLNVTMFYFSLLLTFVGAISFCILCICGDPTDEQSYDPETDDQPYISYEQ